MNQLGRPRRMEEGEPGRRNMIFRHRIGDGGAGEINIFPRLERPHDRGDDEHVLPP